MSEGRKIFYDKPVRGHISVPDRLDRDTSKERIAKQNLKKHVKKTFEQTASESLLTERFDVQTLVQPPEFAHISQEIALLNNVTNLAQSAPVRPVAPALNPLPASPPAIPFTNVPTAPVISVPRQQTKVSPTSAKVAATAKTVKPIKNTKTVKTIKTAKKPKQIKPTANNKTPNLLDVAAEQPFKTPEFIANATVSPAKESNVAKFSKREIQRERRRIEKEEKRRAHEISVAELAAEKHFCPRRFKVLRWSVSLILIVAVGFVVYDTARTNFDMKAYMSRPREAGVYDTVDMVSEEPISKSDMKYHTVSKADPRYLAIDTIGVNSRIFPAGTDEYGRILLPSNIFDVNWYEESIRPGAVGAMVMSGYMSGPTQPGAFSKSSKIKTGDYITVERGDGIKINYVVQAIETMRSEDVNIEEIFQVYDGAGHGLNIIINTGDWANGNLANSDRTIIYSVVSQNQ